MIGCRSSSARVLKSETAKLLEIQPTTPNRQVALMIAAALLESERQPYCFAINHDIRPPKNKPCPLDYDWALKGHVGIETQDRRKAEAWLARAAIRGYTISPAGTSLRNSTAPCHQPYGTTASIAIARRRAEWHQKPQSEKDDDIPF